MTTLANIEAFLDIDIGDRKLRDGRHKKDRNQYYYYENQYYIVKLTKDMWTVLEDCRKTRRLLRENTWCHAHGYASTSVDKQMKCWHQLFLNYDEGLIADHINKQRFDNRNDNLRIVTPNENSRNKSVRYNNTSGKQGVYRERYQGRDYWRVQIRDTNHKTITRRFSFVKLGEDEAKRQAIEKRKELEVLYGYMGD